LVLVDSISIARRSSVRKSRKKLVAASEPGETVFPVIPFGHTPTFMAYPGPVSPRPETLDAVVRDVRERDALLDRPIAWNGGEGVGAGIDGAGCLVVRHADGTETTLDAGEVHLRR